MLKLFELVLNFGTNKTEFLTKRVTLNSIAYLLGIVIKKLWTLLEDPTLLIEKFQFSKGI